MPELTKLTIKLTASARSAISARSAACGCSDSSYVAAVLDQHLAGQPLIVETRKRGLANVEQKRRETIAAGARRAKRSKGERDG